MGTTWTLPRLVGRSQALALALLGDAIDAREAERIGLIWKCVPDAELMKQALVIAERLAKGPTLAFHRTRTMFDKSWTNTFQHQVDEELKTQEFLANSPDYQIGVKAFRTKTVLPFTGKL